jgi:hypothetical protein
MRDLSLKKANEDELFKTFDFRHGTVESSTSSNNSSRELVIYFGDEENNNKYKVEILPDKR